MVHSLHQSSRIIENTKITSQQLEICETIQVIFFLRTNTQ